MAQCAREAKKLSGLIPQLNQLAALLLTVLAAISTQAQSPGAESISHSSEPAQDLTTMSLQDLYNLDVIQLNVSGGHTHPAGEIMFGYSFMFMDMKGHLSGTRDVSEGEILRNFRSASTGMTAEEHMFEVMYAPTNKLSLMLMLPIKQFDMDHIRRDGTRFAEHSDGIGDLRLAALYTVLGSVSKGQRLLVNAGLSFPTGDIDVRNTVMGETFKLEYPMQLGSGTFDLMPGLTYLGESKRWAWGAQVLTTLRIGRNDNGYRLGNEYGLMGWVGYSVTEWFAPSFRINGRDWGNVHGADPEIDPTDHPEGDPRRQGGRRVDALLGANFFVPKGIFKGARLALEAGVPIYESLDGPQLSTRWIFTVGLTYSF